MDLAQQLFQLYRSRVRQYHLTCEKIDDNLRSCIRTSWDAEYIPQMIQLGNAHPPGGIYLDERKWFSYVVSLLQQRRELTDGYAVAFESVISVWDNRGGITGAEGMDVGKITGQFAQLKTLAAQFKAGYKKLELPSSFLKTAIEERFLVKMPKEQDAGEQDLEEQDGETSSA